MRNEIVALKCQTFKEMHSVLKYNWSIVRECIFFEDIKLTKHLATYLLGKVRMS